LPNIKKGGVFGHNHFNTITKAVAARTKMTLPNKCTPSARPRAGITKLANKAAACPKSVQMKAARHSCPSTHAKYQEPSEKMMVGTYKAFLYNDCDYGTFDMCMNLFFSHSN
jgi:hypothetical protein